MAEIIIPAGGGSPRDGSTLMFVNGEECLVPDGVPTDVDAKFVNLLEDIMISYALAGGDFVPGVMDAASGSYTLNGVAGEIEDIFDFGISSLDPVTDIDAGGIKTEGTFGNHNETLYLKDPLLASVLANGATFVVELTLTGSEAFEAFDLSVQDIGANSLAYTGFDGTSLYVVTDGGFDDTAQVAANGVNRLALTVRANHIAVSMNGGAALSLDDAVLTVDGVHVVMNFGSETTGRFRSFEIVEAVNDAALPALSAL